MPPIKFKPTEKNYDRRSGTYTTQHYYMKGTSKKDLFDYINSSNAKPKRIHGILKELKRRGVKVLWK
jgi:hypothetical protein